MRARLEGILWIWSNEFGSCLGGSHPLLSAPYRRSADPFIVPQTTLVMEVGLGPSPPHAEFTARTSQSSAGDSVIEGQSGLKVERAYGYE